MHTPKPFNEAYLPEVDGHSVYYAQYGNPEGEVVVSLHGGPGSQSKAKHVLRFNQSKYQIVLIDQRGCGKSTPRGSIVENTTQTLVADMERVRESLNLSKWFVAGGSWGSTLALLYTETHPDRVKGLLVSAVFHADRSSLDWFNQTPHGAGAMFTDLWHQREFALQSLGIKGEHVANQLLQKLTNGSEIEQKHVAAAFANWEANLLTSLVPISFTHPDDVTENSIHDARIFLHYEANDFFIENSQILDNCSAIEHIPTIIAHGRLDVICPFEQAWKLHQALPASELMILPQSNHKFTPDGEVAIHYAFNAFLEKYGE